MENSFTPGGLEGRFAAGRRGCLAGPVVAAAVILPDDFRHPWLNDSKQVTEARREALRPIIEQEALAWAVAACSPAEIDTLNILRASITAMHRALDAICGDHPLPPGQVIAASTRRLAPASVIIDGNKFHPWRDIPWQTFVKGDSRYGNIAAASILAKTHRDDIMRRLHDQYPPYNWAVNKGYPTADHRSAIAAHGPTPHHRLTFRLLPPTQLTLFPNG